MNRFREIYFKTYFTLSFIWDILMIDGMSDINEMTQVA